MSRLLSDDWAMADRGLEELSNELLEDMLRYMILSRAIEDRCRILFQQSRLRGRLVSGRGEEAIAVGATLTLEATDVVAPVHRDLGAHLVRGTTPLEVMRHYLGRETSLSRGRDGDIHFGDWSRGIFPMVSHLPDSWPVMVGVGLAFKLRAEPGVVLAFCGDGATSTGTWHESLNIAAVLQTPCVFVVENNHYAYSTPTEKQYRISRIADRAKGYGMRGQFVDGNDVVAVYSAVRDAVSSARAGNGPELIEAETFRIDGHAIHDDASYVEPELRAYWRQRDPIEKLVRAAVPDRLARDVVSSLEEWAASEVARAVEVAESEPLPDGTEVDRGVFARLPDST